MSALASKFEIIIQLKNLIVDSLRSSFIKRAEVLRPVHLTIAVDSVVENPFDKKNPNPIAATHSLIRIKESEMTKKDYF